eukprot:s36_g24.t1
MAPEGEFAEAIPSDPGRFKKKESDLHQLPFELKVKARGSACSQFGKHPKFLVYMSPQSTSGNTILMV